MNFSDSEIVASIITEKNYTSADKAEDADIIFLNTCSIRENAEQKVFNRLKQLQHLRKSKPGLVLGVLGCMAERLKSSLLEEEEMGMRVDMVVGPDSYRDLPQLLLDVESGQKAVNVILSSEETYADITPVRYASNGVSAFISIMRGCENFCTYCVVPFTRGKERSRKPESIINEARDLFGQGYREITLLGQNVNSYHWKNEESGAAWTFPQLMEAVASIDPALRIRFATSHPKDISEELLQVIASYNNICKAIHLPAQSGSSSVLKNMNRKYTREEYLSRILAIRSIVPECAVSTDIIAGFCGETQDDHLLTLSLMREVGFDFAYMFKYSERPGTLAAKKLEDDVPEEVKSKRLQEIIDLQNELSLKSNQGDVGKVFEVLVERTSKKSEKRVSGRNSQNKVVVFDNNTGLKPGDYAMVKITGCSSATLQGERTEG
ncbi:MAG: tRNA (N6-isopentenyl adenosine(37)-C2)-methylthiotransferase MiaB [Bacteroidetes bacterium]|nr:MAG: tRNA (N6-isopentenyl adenosine(37)-C2)-methylthiotransferase MiaB [Bacteroidota bacterium]